MIVAAGLLSLALLLVGILALILSTKAGTDWALSQLLRQINGIAGQQVTLDSTEGTLVSGLQLNNLVYQSDAAQVKVERVGINWNPFSLMSARLSVPEILLNNVQAELLDPASSTNQSSQTTEPLISFSPLPVVIDLGSITVKQLIIKQSQQQFVVDELSLSAQLQHRSLALSSINLVSDLTLIAGSLTLLLDNNLPTDAEIRWQYNEQIYPDSGPSSGMLTLAGDLATLELYHQLQQPFVLASEGSVVTGLAGNELNIDLTHSGDSILLPQLPIENLVLNDVNLTTVGSPASLAIALTTEGESGQTPATTLALNANWRNSTLALDDVRLTTETGQLSASGELMLSETITGTLQYQLNDDSPLDYFENQLPLEVLNLTSSGVVEFSQAASSLQGVLRITELSGEFGDYPFQGQGQIRYIDEVIQLEDMLLSTAANQLTVGGVLADELDFSWEVMAPELNQFIEELTGELQASGQISGSLTDMELAADIAAGSVSFNGIFVNDLLLSLRREGQTITGSIDITDAGFRSEGRSDNIQTLALRLDGTEAQHQLSLASSTDYGDMELELQGGFTDLATMSWRGMLRQGRLDTDLGIWIADSTNRITFNSSSITLTDNCWLQNDSAVCLQVAADTETQDLRLRFNGQVSNYPLSVFNHPNIRPDGSALPLASIPHLPEMVGLAGTADAELTFRMESDGSTSAAVNLQPNDMLLTIRSIYSDMDSVSGSEIDPETESGSGETSYHEQIYALDAPVLTASLENSSWNLQAATGISGLSASNETQPLRGTLDSQVQVSPDGELTGDLRANLGDIGWLSAFSQDVDNLEGSLSGTISLAGTINEPQFSVDLQLADGQVSLLPLGITIDQIASNITSLNDGSIQLTTSARSGSGLLELQGLLSDPFTTQRSLRAQISGSDFSLRGKSGTEPHCDP